MSEKVNKVGDSTSLDDKQGVTAMDGAVEAKAATVLLGGEGEYQPKGHMPSMIIFTLLIGLGNLQAGFAIAGNNQVAPVIKAKFGWEKDDATLYNTLISASSIFGVVIGAL